MIYLLKPGKTMRLVSFMKLSILCILDKDAFDQPSISTIDSTSSRRILAYSGLAARFQNPRVKA
jgi:hypothetical protein